MGGELPGVELVLHPKQSVGPVRGVEVFQKPVLQRRQPPFQPAVPAPTVMDGQGLGGSIAQGDGELAGGDAVGIPPVRPLPPNAADLSMVDGAGGNAAAVPPPAKGRQLFRAAAANRVLLQIAVPAGDQIGIVSRFRIPEIVVKAEDRFAVGVTGGEQGVAAAHRRQMVQRPGVGGPGAGQPPGPAQITERFPIGTAGDIPPVRLTEPGQGSFVHAGLRVGFRKGTEIALHHPGPQGRTAAAGGNPLDNPPVGQIGKQ